MNRSRFSATGRLSRLQGKLARILVLPFLLWGCATNPVTGDRELGFVSEGQEVAIGQENYGPTQQSQGGEYEVDPGLSEYVNQVGQRLAAVSDRDLPYEFVVLNNSVPNAWALPGGKIALNRGLLIELDNEAELAAVLGHEIVHAAARHGAQSMERGLLLQGAMLATAVAASDSDYANLIVGGAQLGAQLVTTRYGRDAERESDAYGMRYMARAGYDPAAAVSLQQTFVRLAEGRAPGWLDGLFASHPPSMERVENNQALLQQMRAEGVTGGDLGRERFQSNIAFLLETKPAYDAFDEAIALIQNDRIEDAQEKLGQAISILPSEARFHGLRADIHLHQSNYRAALESYNRAIDLDSNYFDYYLGRGMTYIRQGDRGRAEADLRASVELLPTAVAMNELGTLAMQRNDIDAAKQYFQVAASGGGEAGERAAAAYARLDMRDNPAQYINIQPFVTQGRLGARVVNQSPQDVSSVVIEFQALIGGQRAARNISIPRLAPGQTVDIDSTIAFPEGASPAPNQVSVTLVSLEIHD